MSDHCWIRYILYFKKISIASIISFPGHRYIGEIGASSTKEEEEEGHCLHLSQFPGGQID